ncbi:hypothetical protein PIB30_108909 [Stylosanthes scabra]|uniref:Uncharacterized protein n=1 Tax=Stylosanthes scabra TaxID=79078 RepID=A0ABU6XWZ9_9FABA|nr:hypothetical protein [Stylosanthes scabra]
MGRDADGIWFRSVSPVVFQMQPVNTLEELKCVILCNMGAAGAMPVRRVAYRLLNLFPPNQFKFKIFWVDSDAHVRAMFELHRRPIKLIPPTCTVTRTSGDLLRCHPSYHVLSRCGHHTSSPRPVLDMYLVTSTGTVGQAARPRTA